MKPGDILYFPTYEQDGWKRTLVEYAKWEVVRIYKYFVHCRHTRTGRNQCFCALELREAGYEVPEEMRR